MVSIFMMIILIDHFENWISNIRKLLLDHYTKVLKVITIIICKKNVLIQCIEKQENI